MSVTKIARKALRQNAKENPLIDALVTAFGSDAGSEFNSTVDLVSPGLCDDVLKYIGPSLEEYKGCDIIDIHPGACLWSQKLHDFLQPRRHVLMEPEEKYYKPFIEPLVQKPGSAFRHTTLSGANVTSYFASYEQIFNDEQLLFKKDPLPAGDVRLRQPNKSLLVTGTLSRHYKTRYVWTKHVANTNLILNHMVQASQTNTLFHGYGLVRMLLWNPEDVRHLIQPESAVHRGSFSAALDVAADMVLVAAKDKAGEVWTPVKRLQAKFRHPWVDQLSGDAALQEMDKAGISMPEHRQTASYKSAVERRSKNVEGNIQKTREDVMLGTAIRPLLGHESLDVAIASHKSEVTFYLEQLRIFQGKRRSLKLPYQYKFPLDDVFENRLILKDTDRAYFGPYMDLWGRQMGLESALCQQKATDAASVTAEMTQGLLAAGSDLRTSFLSKAILSKQKRGVATGLLHELHAFNTKLLHCDRRPYEPLAVEANEFWPPAGQALLDIQPRQDNMADDITSAQEANKTMRRVATELWQLSAHPLTEAFERMGPGAARDLLPNLPEVTDASKGGRLDAEDLPVRLMTREMLKATTKAYLDWPFRPDLE